MGEGRGASARRRVIWLRPPRSIEVAELICLVARVISSFGGAMRRPAYPPVSRIGGGPRVRSRGRLFLRVRESGAYNRLDFEKLNFNLSQRRRRCLAPHSPEPACSG